MPPSITIFTGAWKKRNSKHQATGKTHDIMPILRFCCCSELNFIQPICPKASPQTLAQLAIAWVVRRPAITSALIGASKVQQIDDCVDAIEKPSFSPDELIEIDRILAG